MASRRQEEQALVFEVMRNPNLWIVWMEVLYFVTERGNLTLANGAVIDERQALCRLIETDSVAHGWMVQLAKLIYSDEQVVINQQLFNRAALFAWSMEDGTIPSVKKYKTLGMCMALHETVTLEGRQLSRIDIFQKVFKKNEYDLSTLAHIAISMSPSDTFELQHHILYDWHGEFNRQELCEFAITEDLNEPIVMIVLAVLTPDVNRATDLLQSVLTIALDEDYVLLADFAPEPGTDYSALTIGGEDERQALIIAVQKNDLKQFAQSALDRRVSDALSKRRNLDSDSSKAKRIRRKSVSG